MLRLDPFDTHVPRERGAGNDHRFLFDEPQKREEGLRFSDVSYDDGHMVKMSNHARHCTGERTKGLSREPASVSPKDEAQDGLRRDFLGVWIERPETHRARRGRRLRPSKTQRQPRCLSST